MTRIDKYQYCSSERDIISYHIIDTCNLLKANSYELAWVCVMGALI